MVDTAKSILENSRSKEASDDYCMSIKEIITVLTRLGKKSKCFVLADPMQTDLPTQKGGAIKKIHKLFSDEESAFHGIKTFEFNEDDIMRSELCKFIDKRVRTI